MIDRRNFLSTTAAFAAAAATSKLAFAESHSDGKGKDHSQHKSSGTAEAALAEAASRCVLKGEACLQHCVDMLTSGDTSMANCAKTVREMIVYCQALSKAAAQNSKHLKELAKIAMNACLDCEAECKKHASKHEVCRECAESCAACLKQCKTFAA